MLYKTTVIGRIARDPEVKDISDELKVASFTVACDSDYKNDEGERETEWVDCKAWRARAKFVQDYLSKGRLVCIEGRFKTEEWEDSSYTNEEGQALKRRKQVLVVDNIYPLDSKKDQESSDSEPAPQPARSSKGGSSRSGSGYTSKSSGSSSKPLPKW